MAFWICSKNRLAPIGEALYVTGPFWKAKRVLDSLEILAAKGITVYVYTALNMAPSIDCEWWGQDPNKTQFKETTNLWYLRALSLDRRAATVTVALPEMIVHEEYLGGLER